MHPTFNLDEDVLLAVKELANLRGSTAGNVLSDLARAALERPAQPRATRNGVPLLDPGHIHHGAAHEWFGSVGREAWATEQHTFWQDDVSPLDESRLDARALHGHREITDAYLLALAVARSGALATFDRGLRTEAVRGAEPGHVVLLAR